MAATTAVHFKRVQIAPPQSIPHHGFNQRTKQSVAAASLARRQREAAQTEQIGDLCFNLQPRKSLVEQQQQQQPQPQQHQRRQAKTATALPPPIARGASICPGRKYGRSSCATPTGELQRTSNKLKTTKSPLTSVAFATVPKAQAICTTSQQLIITSSTIADKSATRPQAEAHQRRADSLRHWKSSTSSLNCVHLAAIRSRRRVVVSSSTKSLLQLNTLQTQAAPLRQLNHSASRDCSGQSNQHQRLLRVGSLGSDPLESAIDASNATRLLRSHLHRHQIRQLCQGSPAAKTAASVAAARQLRLASQAAPPSVKASRVASARVASLAPKRALSCNQLAQKPEQAPKVAKLVPGSAITNSRLRQGALFARRQCQLAPPLSLADSTKASSRVEAVCPATTSAAAAAATAITRPPHLTRRDNRNQQQQEAYKLTRLAQAHRRGTITTTKTTTTTTKTTTATSATTTTSTTKTISASKKSPTPKIVCKKRDLATGHPTIGRRRWSSLESSNNDDSSPSSSSSTLSTNSSYLLQSPLDYLPTATGSELIERDGQEEARKSDRWRSRGSSSPQLQPLIDQQQQQPLHKRKANERSTRQPAEFERQQKAETDEILDDNQQCLTDAKPNLNSDNPPPRFNCLSRDNKDESNSAEQDASRFCQLSDDLVECHYADIVVGQPSTHQSFITNDNEVPSGKSIREQSTGSHDDNLIGCLSVGEQHQQNRGNCHERQVDSMILVEQQDNSHNSTSHPDGHHPCQKGIEERLSYGSNNNFGPSLGATQETAVSSTDKMMISTGHSDNNETGHREQDCDDEVNDNQDQEVRSDKSQHQPLGLLQAINIEQRQQQAKECSVTKPSELTKVVSTKQQKTDLIPIKQEPICDYYDLEPRPFARGKFAQVKRCVRRDTKECFAAKCIKKRRRLVDIRHEILLEIEALKLSYHTDYIVKLYEVYETPNEMILILEMADGGELQRVLDDEESIDESLVRKMVRQILEGLVHLHDDQIVHLDIKPQNLLLTKPFPNGDIKLCDFGISRRISECEIREICGTPDYTAPEVLQYDPISLNTDMWSLGVVTYVLLSGYSPFGSENKQQTFCNITTCSLDFPLELFEGISEDAIDFVKKLIVLEPSQRLTSRQALNHQWFSQ